jgi:hypothetical protein
VRSEFELGASSAAQATIFILLAFALNQDVGAANPIKVPESIEDATAIALHDTETGFAFKKWYSAFFFQSHHTYEDARLGYSLAYASPAGTSISVYVYDYGHDQIPNGVDGPKIVAQLNTAVEGLVKSNRYANVAAQQRPTLSTHFAQAFHELELSNSIQVKSYTLLRGQNGRYVKIRATGNSEAMELRVASFLAELLQDLGTVEPEGHPTIRGYR